MESLEAILEAYPNRTGVSIRQLMDDRSYSVKTIGSGRTFMVSAINYFILR